MAQKISTSYDFGNLNVSLGTATEDNHAVNKAQMDSNLVTTESNANAYTDAKDSAMKTYVDGMITGLGEYVSNLDPASGLPTTGSGDGGSIDKNDYWIFSDNGTILGEDVHKWEKLVANVDNATLDGDFRVEHMPEVGDTRHEFTNETVPATVDEVLGSYEAVVTQPLSDTDTWVLGGVDIVSGSNLDVVTNTTVAEQATAIKVILDADNTFNSHYSVSDDLAGTLTITEITGEATGVDLSHDEAGIVNGNVTYNIVTNSTAYDLGDLVINHNLGYKYVQVIASNATTGLQLLTPPMFIDTNSLKFINESNEDILISGVISL